jgi:mRNA interferase RelE/StbE
LSDYRIFEADEFDKNLNRLSKKDAAFVRQKLNSFVYPQLRAAPFYGPNIRKLRNYNPPTWRYRIARFRVFYHVDEGKYIVFILSIDQRKDSYR